MRPLLVTIAMLALAGCEREAPDNRTAPPKTLAAEPAAPGRAIEASFDCARAHGQAQELVCADANLAAMDREVQRLAALAAEPAALAEWGRERDACWKSDELRHCVMAGAMLRIHDLRQGLQAAGASDGLSAGPVTYSCKGLGGPLLATFVNSDPGAVALEWSGEAIAIDHVAAASGAKYEGRWNGEQYGFWAKGKEATLTIAGRGDLPCAEGPAG